MVRVGGDVGDEFLGREREEAGEVEGGGGGVGGVGWVRGWEAGESEVVGCYCVGDLGLGGVVSRSLVGWEGGLGRERGIIR